MELKHLSKCNACGWKACPGSMVFSDLKGFFHCPDCNTILNPKFGTTPQGNKFDQEKRRMDLIPIGPLYDWADVLTYDAKKYEDRNWEKGIQWSRIYAATIRHLLAFWDGEDLDSESGLPHIAHAMCGCSFLLEYMKTCKSLDDRPQDIKRILCTMETQAEWLKKNNDEQVMEGDKDNG